MMRQRMNLVGRSSHLRNRRGRSWCRRHRQVIRRGSCHSGRGRSRRPCSAERRPGNSYRRNCGGRIVRRFVSSSEIRGRRRSGIGGGCSHRHTHHCHWNDAQSGPGNLLGNLLCSVAGLLDNTNKLTDVLNKILKAIMPGDPSCVPHAACTTRAPACRS